MGIIICTVMAVVLLSVCFWFIGAENDNVEPEIVLNQAEPVKTYRNAHEIALTYGPLNFADARELAWPPKQFISIKKRNDQYARWAEVDDIIDTKIRYIGSAADCWLRISDPDILGLRSYHLGIVKTRGSFFVFELDNERKVYDLDYDWWNHPYSNLTSFKKFEVGSLNLVFYRNVKPVTIEGKNTNGVAVIDTEGEVSAGYQTGVIGSALDCWITLPDPELPAYMAVRRILGHHRVLYAYDAIDGDDYLMRADKEICIGGYRIILV